MLSIKKKFPILFFLLVLLFVSVTAKAHSILICQTIENFNLQHFGVNKSLTFQGENNVFLKVVEGLLNGTNGFVRLYSNRGEFSFTASNNGKIQMTTDAPSGMDISVSGASLSDQGNFTYLLGFQNENNVKITWNLRLESYIDKYFMVGVGIVGVGVMVASPTWFALAVRKKKDEDTLIERGFWALLLFLIGYCLMITWLWS